MRPREIMATFRGHRVPHVRIVERRRWWFTLSGLLIGLSLIGLLVRGLNYSIEFQGGSLLRYPDRVGLAAAEVRSLVIGTGVGGAEVQILNAEEVSVRTPTLNTLDDATRARLLDDLATQAGIRVDEISRQDVGPTWGGQISRKALTGLVIFLIAVTLFIAFRFEWKMAVGAQAALFHDLAITAGIYALVGREVSPATVIAVLTILGYSLYDTVVIYDRVGEHAESPAALAKETYGGVVNRSLNEVLMRSVNTSLSTLLPVTSLLFFGGETLKDFAFALSVGVVAGSYSSIFVAAPVLAVLKEREPRFRRRAAAGARRPAMRAVPGEARAPATGLEPATVGERRPTRSPSRGRSRGRKGPPAKRKRR